jgi:hypothetical protein
LGSGVRDTRGAWSFVCFSRILGGILGCLVLYDTHGLAHTWLLRLSWPVWPMVREVPGHLAAGNLLEMHPQLIFYFYLLLPLPMLSAARFDLNSPRIKTTVERTVCNCKSVPTTDKQQLHRHSQTTKRPGNPSINVGNPPHRQQAVYLSGFQYVNHGFLIHHSSGAQYRGRLAPICRSTVNFCPPTN